MNTCIELFLQVDEYDGTSYVITGLEPATLYDVVVTTVNDKGTSLPDVTLVLVTQGVHVLKTCKLVFLEQKKLWCLYL